MRTCHAKLRYFDWDGQVHFAKGKTKAKGKTGGQQGDPLEMLIFNLTIHHLWGRVLEKFQEARAVAYADDGYIKGKLSVALQVLAELKRVLKEDAGQELNIAKTSILPKKTTQQAVFDVAHSIIAASPALTQLSGDTSRDSFCPKGFIGDAFVRSFVAKTCRDIIEDVEKLDAINSHIMLPNRCVLQQQHVVIINIYNVCTPLQFLLP